MNKYATHQYVLSDILARRWSPRSYREESVEPEKLHSVLEAARWPASAYNEQPWRYVVGIKNDRTWNTLSDCLTEANRVWALRAPVLMLLCAETISKNTGKPNPFAVFDCGQSLAQLSLQAVELGLHAHPMGGFSREKAETAFELPATVEPCVMIALGYSDVPEKLPEHLRETEIRQRERKGFDTFVFAGNYGFPFELS